MFTATATSEPKAPPKELIPEQRVVLRNVGWDGYETLLRMVGDGHVRLTYDRGDVELMSPSSHHEECKRLLGLIVQALVEELRIPCRGLGSTTWRKQFEERGIEADEWFYIQSFPRIRWVRDAEVADDHAEWGRLIREWIRAEVVPRLTKERLMDAN